MEICLSQFKYDERYDCFVAKAHVGDIYFAVIVDPYVQDISICPVKGGSSAAEVRTVLGYYADMLMDYVAELFGWEAA